MHSVIETAKGFAITSSKTNAESTMASCWMLPVPLPKLWCVSVRAYRALASGTMRELRMSRWVVETALERTQTPSRWSASRAAWRWWDVSFLVESSSGESVIDVISGEDSAIISEGRFLLDDLVGAIYEKKITGILVRKQGTQGSYICAHVTKLREVSCFGSNVID